MEEKKPTLNLKLRRERERRAWSQQELADEVGTTPLNIGRWERGVTQPGPHFRQKLCAVFEKSSYELGLVSSREDDTSLLERSSTFDTPTLNSDPPMQSLPSTIWNVPARRNLFFTGREAILTHLHDALSEQTSPVALAQPQAISGLGGIGKTQTAIEYAYRYRDDYKTILWVRADSFDLLVSDFLIIAALLNLPERNDQDQTNIVKAVVHWFETHDSWLLIFDNADDPDIVGEFLPSSSNGHILLTTRAQAVGTLAHRIELDTMSRDEAIFFLLRRIKRLKGNAPLESIAKTLQEQATHIVEVVDCLPLALDQAAAYIEETNCSMSDYLKFYKTKRMRLLRTRGKDAAGHPEPIATTWSLSFEKIEQANPAAADLLRFCSFLHPDAIPESMITEGASELGSVLQPIVEDELDFNDALGQLLCYSLIKRDVETKTLNIHRLVQAVMKDRMKKDEESMWAERVVRMMSKVFPEVEFEAWDTCQRILPHTQLSAEFIKRYNIKSTDAALLLGRMGDYLFEREQFAQSEQLLHHSLELLQSHSGEKVDLIANCLLLLAWVYTGQGKHEEAEKFALEALAIYEQQFGSTHLNVASTLNCLGEIYWQWTKYNQGEEVALRALQIRQQALEASQNDIAYSLNVLALIYLYQSRNKEAEPLFAQAAAIWERENGLLHPTTFSGITNLGVTYIRLGKYTQAEQILLEILRRREQVERLKGPRDFDIGHSFFNLGLLYTDMGKFALSEKYHQQALQKWEQSVGSNHPRIASILYSLGNTYRIQGKLEEAIPLLKRALSLRKWVHGSENIDNEVANCLYGMAEIARSQGQYDKALSLHQQALTMREQMAGPENLYCAQSLHGLACLFYDTGKYDEAKELFQRAFSIRKSKLGETHPAVAYTLGNLALLYFAKHEFDSAEALFQRALTIQEQSLELTHPHYIEILENYAGLLRVLQREVEHIKVKERLQFIQAETS